MTVERLTDDQEAIRNLLEEAFRSGRAVSVEFLNGETRQGELVEFRDLYSKEGPGFAHTAQVRFHGDTDLANVHMMKSAT